MAKPKIKAIVKGMATKTPMPKGKKCPECGQMMK